MRIRRAPRKRGLLKDLSIIRDHVRDMQRSLHADASSMFSFDGADLRGIGAWDWTRTSFAVAISDWPSVESTLRSTRARYMTLATTGGGIEAGWFDSHGIASSLCVPLSTANGGLGVLFFDFNRVRMPRRDSVERVERAANEWALSLEGAP